MKHRGPFGAVALLALSLLAACGGGGGTSGGGSGTDGTLTFGHQTPVTTLDPDALPYIHMQQFLTPMYDSLTRASANIEPEPALATQWQQASDATGPYIDFTLRTGLTFEDGSPFDATSVLATFERAKSTQGNIVAVDLKDVTAEKVSDGVVRFRNPKGVANLPNVFAGPAGMQISAKAIESRQDLTKKPAGIGMFRLKSYTPARIEYEGTPGYWDSAARKLKKLVFVVADSTSLVNQFRAGQLDALFVSPADVPAAKSVSGAVQISPPERAVQALPINTSVKPFDNPDVRLAMSLAIDREALCKNVLGGFCAATNQLFLTDSPFYDKSAPVQYDPERAKRLIDQAGATGAKAVMLVPAEQKFQQQMVAVVQQQWKAIGIDATIEQIPSANLASSFGTKGIGSVGFAAAGPFFDPLQQVNRFLRPGSLYNPGGFSDPTIESLYATALKTSDPATRQGLIQQMMQASTGSVSMIPLNALLFQFFVTAKVHDFREPLDNNMISFRGVSVG